MNRYNGKKILLFSLGNNSCDGSDKSFGYGAYDGGSITNNPDPIANVPLPAAAWLFLTALAGLIGTRARSKTTGT